MHSISIAVSAPGSPQATIGVRLTSAGRRSTQIISPISTGNIDRKLLAPKRPFGLSKSTTKFWTGGCGHDWVHWPNVCGPIQRPAGVMLNHAFSFIANDWWRMELRPRACSHSGVFSTKKSVPSEIAVECITSVLDWFQLLPSILYSINSNGLINDAQAHCTP